MDKNTINKKLLRGIVSLSFRRAVIYAIGLVTLNIILAPILPVAVLGTFNIASSILTFFTFFSDFGLAAAIIQKKEVTPEDLKTTFTIQQLLALIISVVVWFFAPWLAEIYKLDQSSVWLIRALGVSFFLTSLKVVPSVLLERELKFGPIVWVEIAEAAAFYGLLTFLVYQNPTVDAFTISVIVRSVLGASLIYILAPWKVALGISRQAARTLMNFGIPFQLNSLLALVKDRLVFLFVGTIIGPLGVGYITWAQSLAYLPLEVMNIMIRVTFPAFSRLQEDYEALKPAVEKSLFITSLFLFPMLFGLLAIAPVLTSVVTHKWAPALPLIYLFSINTFWASLSTTFTNILNAIGKIGITLKLMVMWTFLTWILTPIFVFKYGYIGVAITAAIISFTSIIPIMIIKQHIKINIIKNIYKPLIASIIMSVVTYFIAISIVSNLITLITAVCIGGLIYFGLVGLLARDQVATFLVRFKNDETH